MPLYSYECETCSHADDEFQRMSDEHLTTCPKCGAVDYHRRVALPHTDMLEFHKPIELYSVALNTDEEIRAFKRTAPDVFVETDPRSEMYGVPIARSRKQKLAALEATGCVETK